jgi:adenylate cyclase
MKNDHYTKWLHTFMWERLQLGLIIAIISVGSFTVLNLSRYPNFLPSWLYINFIQEVALFFCLGLLYSPIGRRHPSSVFLLFSWSITMIPQAMGVLDGVAKFDLVAWTLVFLGQATLLPVRWRLHLLSQLALWAVFLTIQFVYHLPFDSEMIAADPVYYYLYLFWFCVICNLSVYLYEKLQYSEFQAKLHLQAEQEKSERLLLNILPESIAKRLKQQQSTIAEDFSQVSVLFADIVGFTEMSERISPPDLVQLLNKIFSRFDKLVEQHGLEKIKTIGDAYMVVAGLPSPRPDHVTQIADLALEMQTSLAQFNQEHQDDLKLRIGIHTGPVVAGVIGIKKFAYDLWGDTVNTASRMESYSMADCIQVSEHVYQALKDKYILIERGRIEIKGKGKMTTFFLKGKRS